MAAMRKGVRAALASEASIEAILLLRAEHERNTDLATDVVAIVLKITMLSDWV